MPPPDVMEFFLVALQLHVQSSLRSQQGYQGSG